MGVIHCFNPVQCEMGAAAASAAVRYYIRKKKVFFFFFYRFFPIRCFFFSTFSYALFVVYYVSAVFYFSNNIFTVKYVIISWRWRGQKLYYYNVYRGNGVQNIARTWRRRCSRPVIPVSFRSILSGGRDRPNTQQEETFSRFAGSRKSSGRLRTFSVYL